MYSYNNFGVECAFHLLQETRSKYHPLPRQEHLLAPLLMSRNVEPLESVLCISATVMRIAQSIPSASLKFELLSTPFGTRFSRRRVGDQKV